MAQEHLYSGDIVSGVRNKADDLRGTTSLLAFIVAEGEVRAADNLSVNGINAVRSVNNTRDSELLIERFT